MTKDAVCDFLRRCVQYADESIERKKERDEDIAEIERWSAYRDFTAYALSEVERGELDDWFEGDGESGQKRETLLGQSMGFAMIPWMHWIIRNGLRGCLH